MNIESLREYCLQKKNVTEELPFINSTLVFKVSGKIFLLTGLDRSPFQFNVKCDPDKAIELREQYESVKPGYHMNKKHWISVYFNKDVPYAKIKELVQKSHNLIIDGLSNKQKEILD